MAREDLDALQRVLLAIPPSGATVAEVATRVGLPEDHTRRLVADLETARRIELSGDRVRLTGAGEPLTSVDLTPLTDLVQAWSTGQQRRAAAHEASQDALLASDTDRDQVTRLLADAFAHGRLDHSEFDARTSRALAARTHGDLDDVLAGLGGLPEPAHERRPVRTVIFWGMTVLTSPFLLLSGGLLAFGSDLDDRVIGIVLLVLFLPGLLALRRWAHPRAT